ncbi:MAG: hypothetical protein J6Y37_18545 [Paludibacteraceae bacterium]|nr:hypothetical protein [Paludibacteraceae bacterium]
MNENKWAVIDDIKNVVSKCPEWMLETSYETGSMRFVRFIVDQSKDYMRLSCERISTGKHGVYHRFLVEDDIYELPVGVLCALRRCVKTSFRTLMKDALMSLVVANGCSIDFDKPFRAKENGSLIWGVEVKEGNTFVYRSLSGQGSENSIASLIDYYVSDDDLPALLEWVKSNVRAEREYTVNISGTFGTNVCVMATSREEAIRSVRDSKWFALIYPGDVKDVEFTSL